MIQMNGYVLAVVIAFACIVGAGAGYATGASRVTATVAVACPAIQTAPEKPFLPPGHVGSTKGMTW